MLAYLVVLSFLNLINVCGVGFSIAVFFKERKKERIFISQPQHDRYS
jgi:predicted exporter